jgi:hypothetical protein
MFTVTVSFLPFYFLLLQSMSSRAARAMEAHAIWFCAVCWCVCVK